MQDGSHAAPTAAPELRVRYFAVLRELAGVDEEQLALGPGLQTVADLVRTLEARHPSLAGRLGRARVARNQRLAAPDERLAAGDVLQLIPPLAGILISSFGWRHACMILGAVVFAVLFTTSLFMIACRHRTPPPLPPP